MAEKTKRGSIPSIKITKEFIRSLGSVLESEVNERNLSSQTAAEKEIQKREREIESGTFYRDEEEKEQAKIEMRERVKDHFIPNIGLTYSIEAENEELTFSSVDEVIDTRFFPEKIENMVCRVSHYGKNQYVDVNVNISQSWIGAGAYYKLSSTSEQRLLKIESDLKNLFKQNPTDYKFLLYPNDSISYWVPRVYSVFLAIAAYFLVYKNFALEIKSDADKVIASFVWISLFVYLLGMKMIKWIFPYFKFEISNENQFIKYARYIISAVIFGVIITAATNFIFSL